MNVSETDYFSNPGYSQSDMKQALESPELLHWMKHEDGRAKRKPSPQMIEGTLAHAFILEPDKFNATYKVCGPRNTKAGKEEAKEAVESGRQPITLGQYEKALGMNHAVSANRLCNRFFVDGLAEQSFFSEDDRTALPMKARLDWITPGDTIVDLKTVAAGGASPANFVKQVANFSYHLQAAHYLEMSQMKRFVFVVVEREPPFQIGVYQLDDDAIAEGRYLRHKALDLIANCQVFNNWPGHTPLQPQTLSLPQWAYN
jgi:exodeoxyribonuclease VIII